MKMNMSVDRNSDHSQQTSASTSRWNPTKEQIDMLEGLYKKGIRTPSAEQIQQITSKLKVYGHIEGKNVFYWFQNHKARQRQKQKQDQTTNITYFNSSTRFLHNPTSVFIPPPSPPPPPPPPPPLLHIPPYNNNVICNQYYLPVPPLQPNNGHYHQYPMNKVALPPSGVVRRRSSRTGVMMEENLEHSGANANYNGMMRMDAMHRGGDVNEDISTSLASKNSNRKETLSLFPLHPTGVLDYDVHQPNEDSFPFADDRVHDKPYFDFFAGQGQQH